MSNIESVLHETRVFEPSPEAVRDAAVSGMDAYRALCAEAERNPSGFWSRLAKENVLWHRPFSRELANGLKSLGYRKGDRSIIYMPMSIEAVVAMQACARLGIIHSVVFGRFSAKSVQERIVDVGASLVICADEQMRGGKPVALKPAIDEALAQEGC